MNAKQRKWVLLFDRALSSSLLKQTGILLVLMLLAFILSFLMLTLSGSDWETFCDAKHLSKWLLPLYLLIDTNALNNLYINEGALAYNNSWMLTASSITFIMGLIIFGMIISVITNTISRRVEDHRSGKIFYLKSGHYIIMGYDDMVPAIIEEIFSKNKDAYILILSSIESETIRKWLNRSLSSAKMDHIIINFGHRTMPECYDKIHLESAKEIFIVGWRTKETHDAMNVENVDSICDYLSKLPQKAGSTTPLPNRITCVFEDLDTYTAFKTTEIFAKVKELDIEFVPYNFYSGWAKQIFVNRCYKNKSDESNNHLYPSMLREDDGEERYAHLVFVGTTNCAVAMAMEAAQILHFPVKQNGEMRKTHITFIEENADKEMDQFITRNHHFFNVEPPHYMDLSRKPEPVHVNPSDERGFLDVEFHFIKGDIYSKKVQDLLCEYAKDKSQSLSIFIAMKNQKDNFTIGMNLPDDIYFNDVPVFIRQDRSDNFVTNLRTQDRAFCKPYCIVENGNLIKEQRHGRYANIYPFGMTDTGFSTDNISLLRAKLINYLYNTIDGNKMKSESLLNAISDDTILAEAQKKWKELKVADKWSNLYCAYSLGIKLETRRKMRQLNCSDTSQDKVALNDDEKKVLAVMEHNRWNVEKLLMGFSKPKENEDKYQHEEFKNELKNNKRVFIHHDIRPYDKLDGVKNIDIDIVDHIPWLLKITERNSNL